MAISNKGHNISNIFFKANLFVLCILIDGCLIFAGDGRELDFMIVGGHADELEFEIAR